MTMVVFVVCTILVVRAWCILRFAHARSIAQRRVPRVGEVWVQDNDPLYIVRVTNSGEQLCPGGSGQGVEWSDTW
jgi:hypothetical protein